MILQYLQSQIKEIQNDKALRWYGVCVALGQVLTCINWLVKYKGEFLAQGSVPICWPFFESCFEYRFFDYSQIKLILLAYGFISVVGVLLFLHRNIAPAYWWLIGVNVIKTLIYVQDYRLRMNQHYMLYVITLVFLLIPHKRRALRYMLVMFYFWAGLLKVNKEWLSGAALYNELWFFKGGMLSVACGYAVILEIFISWGMLAANRIIYWSSVAQIALFHIISYSVVGFFYPALMFVLLMIFPITRWICADNDSPNLFISLFTGKEYKSIYGMCLVFSVLQIIPHLIPGDSRITGEGRLFSLHMFDAKVKCEGAITLKSKDHSSIMVEIPYINRARTKCDPIVNMSLAQWHCYTNKTNPQFDNLDLQYSAGLSSESSLKPLVNIQDFCSQDIHYSMLKTNAWIIK